MAPKGRKSRQRAAMRIGDVVPRDHARRPFGAACDPAWYILTAPRTRVGMVGDCAWLCRTGADEAWFPEEPVWRMVRRGPRTFREQTSRPIVAGIVFMRASSLPQWDVLADRKRIRPLMIGDMPVAVTEAVMAQMEQVPQRIADLRDAVETLRLAEAEANRPRPGEDAVFTAGPFAGIVVQVHSIDGDTAVLMIGGGRVTADVAGLRRTRIGERDG